MPNSSSKPRSVDLLAAMVDGYTPAIGKALEGTSPKSNATDLVELRELLQVWEEIRVRLAQGHEI